MSLSILTDFPDRLSPMLVKELRQGLRAKTFIAVFLSLQASLALILFSAGAAASTNNAGNVISAVIFSFFAIAVLVVQPLRGIGSVAAEIKSNTIDMMVLTRLSATRIVFGKWFALVSQSALLLATIIPYLILRYFFGGMNLIGEIVLLILIFLTSMALTAVTVGLSGSSSIILRALLPIFGLPILAYGVLVAMFARGGRDLIDYCSLADDHSRIFVAVYIAAITYFGWAILSQGSSMIAPAAENHSTARRCIVILISLIAAAFMTYPGFDKEFLWLLFTIVALPGIGTALTERSLLVASVRAAFDRRGVAGKAGSLFLAPGWPAGVFFSAIIAIILTTGAFIAAQRGYGFSHEEFISVLSCLGALLFPAVILILFRTDESTRVANYLLLLIGSVIFMAIMLAVSESLSNKTLLWFFIWNPITLAPLIAQGRADDQDVLIAAAAIDLLYFLLLIGAAVVAMKRQRQEHQTAAAE